MSRAVLPPDIIHATPDGRWSSRLAERSRTSSHAYRLIVAAERSAASHRQYMASVQDYWANLPEHLAEEFPTPDDLRGWALIRTGFCEAHKVVGKQVLRRRGYCVVVTDKDGITTVYTAKSQAYGAMDKKEFQASKTAVLDYLDAMVNTSPEERRKTG